MKRPSNAFLLAVSWVVITRSRSRSRSPHVAYIVIHLLVYLGMVSIRLDPVGRIALFGPRSFLLLFFLESINL